MIRFSGSCKFCIVGAFVPKIRSSVSAGVGWLFVCIKSHFSVILSLKAVYRDSLIGPGKLWWLSKITLVYYISGKPVCQRQLHVAFLICYFNRKSQMGSWVEGIWLTVFLLLENFDTKWPKTAKVQKEVEKLPELYFLDVRRVSIKPSFSLLLTPLYFLWPFLNSPIIKVAKVFW